MRNNILVFIFAFACTCVTMAGSTSPEPNPVPFRSSTCRSDFGSYAVSDGSSAEVVSAFIQKQIPNLQNKQTPLQLTFSTTSPGGYHYTFCQTYAGIPILTAEVTVNVSRENRAYSIFDDSYDISQWNVNLTDFNYQDVSAYQAFVKQYFPYPVTEAADKVIAYDAGMGAPLLAYMVTVRDGRGHMRYAVVARDHLVYQRDGLMYHHAAAMPPDSTVTLMVNYPDPLTRAHVLYYAPYMGHDSAYQNFMSADGILDSCTVQLDTQRVQRSITADFTNDTFYLNSHYIILANPEGLGFTPANSPAPSFDFYRCEEGFNDMMVFYHLNTIRSYVNSLGFNSTDTPITADPHFYSQDESFFEVPNSVHYGTGGVPDAEDADVVVHEYTHFISWNSNHSNGIGASEERNGVDEGSGDYDAASYSASIDTFHWYWVFNWDGHNEYWPGRWVNNMTVYPALPNDPGVMGIYEYAEIWSSSMMQIWWAIGKGAADSLFLESLYGMGSNIHLTDAAQQYIKADSVLFNGLYHCTIVAIFNQHGLLYPRVSSGGGDTLIASPMGAHYQWLLNGVPITGATSQMYIASAPGNYSLVISDGSACMVADTSAFYYPLGISNISTSNINIWPNPFTDRIEIGLGDMDNADIEIYSMLGIKVLGGAYPNHASIDMSGVASGVYIVHIKNSLIDTSRMITK